MTVLIEDTPRNTLGAWTIEAINTRAARGAVISPFTSPFVGNTYKPSAVRTSEQIRAAGGEVWFDAATHAAFSPGAGDWRYYDEWDLWESGRGDLATRAARQDHIGRVFARQDELGATHLAPSVLVQAAGGPDNIAAVAMIEDALELDGRCWATIAGTPAFWCSGDALDRAIGSLAQAEPAGWFLTVVRPTGDFPLHIDPAEIHGLCRTVRSLSEFANVHISHGDFAGLPALGAGATSLGSGGDPRQRVCHFGSYEERVEATGGGGWFKRPTVSTLLAFLPRQSVERLFQSDETRARQIFTGPLHPDAPRECFIHHVETLTRLGDRILADGSYPGRFARALEIYDEARLTWPEAAVRGNFTDDSSLWVAPLREGLLAYGSDEGWV